MQTEAYCGIKPLTDEELKSLVKSEADNLDFDTTFNYLFDLSKADQANMQGAARIEKMMCLVRHAHLNGFSKGIELYNDVVKTVLNDARMMKIDDIKIYPCFAAHEPKPEKMERKEQYFTETGLLQSQIILDSRGNLIDGYTSYLLARAHGIQCVPVRYGRRQIVRASHKPGGKLYTWELPGILIDRVSAGDKAVVRTERGVRTVIVEAVEEYTGNEPDLLRMVLRIARGKSNAET